MLTTYINIDIDMNSNIFLARQRGITTIKTNFQCFTSTITLKVIHICTFQSTNISGRTFHVGQKVFTLYNCPASICKFNTGNIIMMKYKRFSSRTVIISNILKTKLMPTTVFCCYACAVHYLHVIGRNVFAPNIQMKGRSTVGIHLILPTN